MRYILFLLCIIGLHLSLSHAQSFRNDVDSKAIPKKYKKKFKLNCFKNYAKKPVQLPKTILESIENPSQNLKLDSWYLYHWAEFSPLISQLETLSQVDKVQGIKLLKKFIYHKKYLPDHDVSFPSLYMAYDFFSSSNYGDSLIKLKIKAPTKVIYQDSDVMLSRENSLLFNEINQNLCTDKNIDSNSIRNRMLWLLAFEDNHIDLYDYFSTTTPGTKYYGYSQLINLDLIEDYEIISFNNKDEIELLEKYSHFETYLSSLTEDEIKYYISMPIDRFHYKNTTMLKLDVIFNNNVNQKDFMETLQKKISHVLQKIPSEQLLSSCRELKKKLLLQSTVQTNPSVRSNWFCEAFLKVNDFTEKK